MALVLKVYTLSFWFLDIFSSKENREQVIYISDTVCCSRPKNMQFNSSWSLRNKAGNRLWSQKTSLVAKTLKPLLCKIWNFQPPTGWLCGGQCTLQPPMDLTWGHENTTTYCRLHLFSMQFFNEYDSLLRCLYGLFSQALTKWPIFRACLSNFTINHFFLLYKQCKSNALWPGWNSIDKKVSQYTISKLQGCEYHADSA